MNARFWVFENDAWVKLTLRPGQTLRWEQCQDTDEGYSYRSVRWSHHGELVVRYTDDGGRDCDGRHETRSTDECPLGELQSVACDLDDGRGVTMRPDWREAQPTEAYDEYAQSAGY